MFMWVYGTAADSGMKVTTIPPEGQRLLGIGVLLGLVVQALAMIPYLRETGFRLRLRFDWKGHGLGKAVTLAKWTFLFVLANQAGAIVVSQLSTAAGKDSPVDGTGFAAYANAQLIWGLPQAIITVSLMAALLPRLSRSAAEGDGGAVRDDISQGLRTTAVAIVPIAFGFLALGIPMCTLIFGSSGTSEATNMGFMLMAFGLGLVPYSVQYVVLRAFYAYEDTRTPFYNTVIVAAVNAGASVVCYFVLDPRWAVVGMAASYGLAYASPGTGCASGSAVTSTALASCGPTRGCASPPCRPPRSAERPATASATRWVRGSSVLSPRCWPAGRFCSASSTSPPAVCASRNSTPSSAWSADAWVVRDLFGGSGRRKGAAPDERG
jgi:murein biosynthesis integral membrane protein MurJ